MIVTMSFSGHCSWRRTKGRETRGTHLLINKLNLNRPRIDSLRSVNILCDHPLFKLPLPLSLSLPHLKIEKRNSPTIQTQTQRKKRIMGECKRCCSLTVLAMEEPSSSQHSIFKKRKTTATAAHSTSFQLCSSDMQFPHTIVSPEVSFSSACTVVSGEFCSDRSCCSSSHVKDLHSVPSDLQVRSSKF